MPYNVYPAERDCYQTMSSAYKTQRYPTHMQSGHYIKTYLNDIKYILFLCEYHY